MADRLATEEIVALLTLLRSYPDNDHSIAPVRVHEAVSVLDEVLDLRAEIAHLRGLATAPLDGRDLDADPEWDDEDDADPEWCDEDDAYEPDDDTDYHPDDLPSCHGCGVCDACTEQTAYEMADIYRAEVERLYAEVASLQRNAEWACESPPPGCNCAGCAQARAYFSGEVDDG